MKPNIIYILADDMGYGDVSGLNPESKIHTPNLDQMMNKGMAFTDAHSSSSVCTPSRYSILTGRYCWRTYLKKGVLSGVGDALIEEGRETLAHIAKKAGYDTACIGKWHMGWTWAVKDSHQGKDNRDSWDGNNIDWIDYSAPIKNGPTACGFDEFYGIAGSLDMPPYVYVENDRPVEEPTAWGASSEFFREGPRMASLRANDVLGHITDKACCYIEAHREEPFFLYFPLTAPHSPIAPAPAFVGSSGISPYADFCKEVDHRVGQIIETLRRTGQYENTLVVFTSDNGASCRAAECEVLEKHYGHHSSYIYRGYKSDIWDGGHRIPFLMQWPEQIESGSLCSQRVGIFDFFATMLEMTGIECSEQSGEDSLSLLPAMLGKTIDEDQRWGLIHHSIEGMFAIRQGPWKLCRCAGSGGWTSPKDSEAERDGMAPVQLYNMAEDPSETTNCAELHPELISKLTEILHRCVVSGRSKGTDTGKNIEMPDSTWPQINWLPEIPQRYVVDD